MEQESPFHKALKRHGLWAHDLFEDSKLYHSPLLGQVWTTWLNGTSAPSKRLQLQIVERIFELAKVRYDPEDLFPLPTGALSAHTSSISLRLPKPQGRTLVFLCHAAEDKAPAARLYAALANSNVQPWLDVEDLLPGQDWASEIKSVLQQADACIVLLSQKTTTKRGFVQREIRMALDIADEQPEGRIYLIPARLEECSIPTRLAHLHVVDLYRAKGTSKLLQSINEHCSPRDA